MKRIIILILVIFSFSFASSINECKIDIYFGNGVWNTEDQARNSANKLYRILNYELIKKYGKVKLAYNWGQGWDIDLVETFYQLKKAGQLSEKTFFFLIDEILTKRAAYFTDTDLKTMREKLIAAITANEQKNVNEMIKQYYNQSFKYSHRVLLVSHSQGNLFANRVYDNLTPKEYQNYFANVQVASPASSVHAKMGSYITGWIDPVINPIPGSMQANADLDSPGHAFVSAYLASKDTYDNIVAAIKQQLKNLENTKSMWEIDKKPKSFDKCEDIRVEMAHKFDDKIDNISNVYPFNTKNYKLYPVNGKYVIASECGGKEIIDSWESKKENQCYWLAPTDDIIEKKSYVVCLVYSRPGASIYSSSILMCNCDTSNGKTTNCTTVASGASGNGFKFWDVFNSGPCQGYDRYKDSKWAGTEYDGIFNDLVLAIAPFETESGFLCSNYFGGCCTCNDNNFKTYYELNWNENFENAYKKFIGEEND